MKKDAVVPVFLFFLSQTTEFAWKNLVTNNNLYKFVQESNTGKMVTGRAVLQMSRFRPQVFIRAYIILLTYKT